MNKIGYLFKRIRSTNYKSLFDTIKFVHKKNGKNKLSILSDIKDCRLKYQADYKDYKIFEMYNLNEKQRETIITHGFNNKIIEQYNNQDYIHFFQNKVEFNQKFNKYLLRDWMIVNENNFDSFKEFTKLHNEIIVEPVAENNSEGIEKIKVTSKNVKEIYNNLLETKRNLVEETITQCKEMSKLHPPSINTIRAVTLNHQIVAAYLSIGNDNNVVVNINHGGLIAPINIETGIIDYLAIDKDGNIHEKHPLTGESILWFQIPKWPRIKRFIERASHEIPEVGYVGWDICLSDKGPLLIEGTEFPEHDIYQLPPHRTDGIGMKPRFIEAMNKKGEDENENSNRN